MILFSPPIEMLKSQILILKKKKSQNTAERVKERVRRYEEESAKLREGDRDYLFQFWMFEALRMNAKLKEDISPAPG